MTATGNRSGGNHLARIVERARGDVDVAAPRVPGLFEPLERSSPAPAADASPGSDTLRNHGRAGHAERLDGQVNPQAGERFHAARVAHVANSPADLHSQSRREPSAPGMQDNLIRPERLAVASPSPLAAASFPIPAPETPQPEKNRSPLQTPARHEVAGVRAARVPPVEVERDSSRRRARAVREEIDALSSNDVSPRAGVLVAQRIVEAQALPPLRVHAAARDIAPDAVAPPDIHISIGRVEVRAQVTAARPAAARATPIGSATRLDAYLRRRERAR